MSRREPLDRLYALVANEEDARTCRDISEEACREVPGNFFKIILANVLTTIGDLLISPKTVLAWVIGALAGLSLYLGPAIRADLRATGTPPPVIWAWAAGMLAMLVTLWIGHLGWSLGTNLTIKSTVGWAKGWALLALYLLCAGRGGDGGPHGPE